jgi:hypothetical protein
LANDFALAIKQEHCGAGGFNSLFDIVQSQLDDRLFADLLGGLDLGGQHGLPHPCASPNGANQTQQ